MDWQTDHLLLRPFRDSDAPAFSEYRSDPHVAEYQGWEMPYGLEKAQAFIAAMKQIQLPGQSGEWCQIAIELRSSGALIGDIAFHLLRNDQRQAEMGATLARPYQGFGYGREAVTRLLEYLFDELHLHRVYANCDVENPAAAQLLERLGLRREAHFIKNLWFKGHWASEYWYAMLDKEWEALRRP